MSSADLNQAVFETEVAVDESHIDAFGHMNNSKYLEIFEQARWRIIDSRGYGIDEIKRTRLGPVILEVNLRFMKEIRLGETVRIVSTVDRSQGSKKAMTMIQKMIRVGSNVESFTACEARFVFGLFDLNERKLVAPTEAWSRAVGLID